MKQPHAVSVRLSSSIQSSTKGTIMIFVLGTFLILHGLVLAILVFKWPDFGF